MTADQYPSARRLDLTEDLFGHQVGDPYRWLEDADSVETGAWLSAQDDLFRGYAGALPGVTALAERILELTGTGHIGVPVWRDDRQFFTRRLPGQEHAVLCTLDPGAESARTLIDPIAIDTSGLTTLDGWQPDKEGRSLAYQLSEGGSEESRLRVMDVETGELVDGPIDRCRYSRIAWLPGGKAFYYTRRLPPDEVPAGEEQFHRRVYLHRVGSPAEDDVMIFGEGRDKTTYYSAAVSRDGRWLTISAARGTEPRNDLWIADLTTFRPGDPRPEGGAGRRGRPDGCPGGAGRAAVRVHRYRRAAGPDRDRRPGERGPGGLAGPRSHRPRGGPGGVRDPRRRPRGPAGAAGGMDPARGRRDHRARPGDGGADRDRPAAGTGHRRRAQRTAGRRPRGVVRLYRQHDAGDGAALRREHRRDAGLGPAARCGGGSRGDRPADPVPLQRRHRGADARRQPGRQHGGRPVR